MEDDVIAEPALETYVWVRGEPSSDEDAEVPGVYLVMTDPGIDEPLRVDAALSVFHDEIGIGVLDDFEIFVADEDGVVLSQPENEIPGSSRHAQFMGSIGEENWPALKDLAP